MLNPFVYFKNNRRIAALILAILAIGVFCVSFVVTLILSVYSTSMEASCAPFKRFAIASYKGGAQTGNASDELKKLLNDDAGIYEAVISPTPIKTVFGTTSAFLVFFADSDAARKFALHCGVHSDAIKMLEEGKKQLLLHENILKNKSLSVGSSVNEIEISGSFAGVTMIGIGCMDNDMFKSLQLQQQSSVIVLSEDCILNINEKLDSLDKDDWQVYTYEGQRKKLDEEFEMTNTIFTIVIITVSVSLSIAIAAFMHSVYANRYDEFAILNAIGFTKGKIKAKMLLEILFISAVSWAIGYLISLLMLSLSNAVIYSGMGQSMRVFSPEGVIYTLILPTMSIVFTLIPIIRRLSKTDLISIIERR